MKLLRTTLCIGFAAIILMTPSVFNRSPFLFYDTSSYLEIGRSIAARLPAFHNLIASEAQTTPQGMSTVQVSNDKEREHISLSYAGGRSPYYSFLIYVLIKFGGLWSIVVLQALLTAVLLWIAYRLVSPSRSAIGFVFGIVMLAGLTSLSFYVGMIMPDVFAGLALFALGLLTLGFDRLSMLSRIGLVVVVAGAGSTHATIPIVCAVGLLCVFATLLFMRTKVVKIRWDIAIWAAVSVALPGLLSALYLEASSIILGAAPQSPPYFMARVLADGTGRAYLRQACYPLPRYSLCAFQNRKFRDDYEFLWDGDPAVGVFSVSDYETRKRLKAEEFSFVRGTILHYPLWQARVSADHWYRQLVSFGLSEFQTAKRSWDVMALKTLITGQEALYTSSVAYRGHFPFNFFAWLQVICVAISIAFLAYRFTGADVRKALKCKCVRGFNEDQLLVAARIGLLGALFANAGICGIFAGVNDRYQARVIWLVPALAMLVLSQRIAQNHDSALES
jgi:hypothetical protein